LNRSRKPSLRSSGESWFEAALAGAARRIAVRIAVINFASGRMCLTNTVYSFSHASSRAEGDLEFSSTQKTGGTACPTVMFGASGNRSLTVTAENQN
jgi:hypothetical protein